MTLTTYEAGLAALARHDWATAVTELEAAAAADSSANVLEALGRAYFWTDDPRAVAAREAAYRGYRGAGDPHGAARVALALAFDHSSFLGQPAAAQGWLELARRALADNPLSVEHGYLAAWQADFSYAAGDTAGLVAGANRVIEIAAELGNSDLDLIGRAQLGLGKVMQGEVDTGMRLLDATAVAAVAGELGDIEFAGYVCCYLIGACGVARDTGRATEWCAKLDAHCRKVGFQALQQVCRAEYAEVLVETGDWQQAESTVLLAADQLHSRRPGMESDALVRLGELRRRQGRRGEAADLFARSEGHPAAALGLAALALDAGDHARARALAERYLRQRPAADRLGRFPGLEVLVSAAAGTGDLAEAAAAVAELRETVATLRPGPLRAASDLAEATYLLAAGDHDAARRAAEDAVDGFDRAGSPFGAARARALLSQVLIGLGDWSAARIEADAATRAFDALGAPADADRARPGPGAGAITPRETDVLRLVAQGLTNADVAERLVLSEHTVHRHIANAMAKLEVSTRAAAVARAAALGLL